MNVKNENKIVNSNVNLFTRPILRKDATQPLVSKLHSKHLLDPGT